jgi:hypothetical protein
MEIVADEFFKMFRTFISIFIYYTILNDLFILTYLYDALYK